VFVEENMNTKLVFLDIDGTLTSPGTSVPSESAQKAIRHARAAGHKVFLCTGRNWGMLQPLLSYGFDGVIGSAGGYVVCDGKVLYDHPMSNEKRDWVIDVLTQAGVFYCLEARDAAYNSPEAMRLMTKSRPKAADSELTRWKRAAEANLPVFLSLAEYDGSPIYKFMYISQNLSSVVEAERILEREFFICRQDAFSQSGTAHGELINRDFDKGTGMRCICEHLGRSMKDTIGFGDSMNDLAMLEAAETSVCMENGSEELKKHSDYVCPPVDQDGLYKGFLHLGLIDA